MEKIKIRINYDIDTGILHYKKGQVVDAYVINNNAYIENIDNKEQFHQLYDEEFSVITDDYILVDDIDKELHKIDDEISTKKEKLLYLINAKKFIIDNKIKDKKIILKTLKIFDILNKNNSKLDKSIEIGKLK